MYEKIVLIGDSLTEGHHWSDLDPAASIVNLGLSGDTSMGVFYRLGLLAHARPNLVFLQVGVNDLSQGREPQELAQTHERIWRAIAERAPEAKLVVCSLAPIRESKFCWAALTLTSERILRANALLAQAAKAAGVDYIDLHSALADSAKDLPEEFTDDGVHLTEAAYAVWLKELKAYLNY
jgi:lysophospholipase L1-like esterase